MKKLNLIVIIACILFSTLAYAGANGQKGKLISLIGEWAETTMTARQSSVSFETAMRIVDESTDDSKAVKLMKLIVISAYKEPVYSNVAMRQKAIREFRDKWALIAYEALHQGNSL